jgi:hypothetical protein
MPDKATQKQEAENAYWRQDLNPDYMEGQNIGLAGANPEKGEGLRTAYDVKNLHNRLQGYTDDELKDITLLPVGARLEQGATYIDLRADDCREFTARGDMEVGPENWYVAKSEMDYQLWNRLIGVDNPERLGQADDA